MAVTPAATALAISSVVNALFSAATILSVKNSSGEFFRKSPTTVETVTAGNKIYTYYLNEAEGNTSIVSVSLYGNGATAALGTGTEIATQALSLTKGNTQSLTIEWEVTVS